MDITEVGEELDVFLATVVDVDILLQNFTGGNEQRGAEEEITQGAPMGDDGGFFFVVGGGLGDGIAENSGFFRPFFEEDKEAIEGGMGFLDAGEFVVGDRLGIGFVVVICHGHVYTCTIDGDSLYVDGTGEGIIHNHALAYGQQFEPWVEFLTFKHCLDKAVLCILVIKDVGVVVVLKGIVQRSTEFIFEEVMLGGINKTSHRLEVVDGIAGGIETQLFCGGDNHDVLSFLIFVQR